MSRPYICLRCSRGLCQPVGQLRYTSFVSLGKPVDRERTNKPLVNDGSVAVGESSGSKKSDPKKRSFAQRHRDQLKPTDVDQVLESLFSSTRVQENAAQISRYSRTPKDLLVEHATSDKSIDVRLLELQKQSQQRAPRLEHIWASCLQLLGERDWKAFNNGSQSEERRTAELAFRDVLLRICTEPRETVNDTTLTPAAVIETYWQHGVMNYWWTQVIWAMVGEILQLKNKKEGVDANTTSREKIPIILQDMAEVWLLFLEKYGTAVSKVSSKGASQTPRITNTEEISSWKGTNVFSGLLPKHPNNTHIPAIVSAALMTFELLNAEGAHCSPLLGKFFRNLQESGDLDVDATRAGLSEAGVDPVVIAKALKGRRKSPRKDPQEERKPKMVLNWDHKSVDSRLADIDGLSNQKDTEGIINLWANFLSFVSMGHVIDKKTSDRVFTCFLHTFWAMKRVDRAIDVWNYMVELGQSPHQAHWDAMLTGCIRARDASSMQEIWTNMYRSSVKPDIRNWNTYIHGLIQLRKLQEGFQALELLGRTWKQTTNKGRPHAQSLQPPSDSLAPSMLPVHGALSALNDIQKQELHPIVISWAEAQDLRLETYTFNILLKPLVRTGTQAQILSHLAQMAEHKCTPDIVTFTIILNGLVSNKDSYFHTLPTNAQESTLISIIDDMEGKGLPPNTHTYSTVLYGLLEGNSELSHFKDKSTVNVSAARTILAHMQKRNMYPNSHVYTILIRHYFASNPPDLPAVGSLWASIVHSQQTSNLDGIFYDRLIEGYADLDEIEKALQILRRVPDEGKCPSWQALYRVLVALDRVGEWDSCKELMRDIEDMENGLLKHGQGVWRGKRQFYELVDHLREKGVMIGGEPQI